MIRDDVLQVINSGEAWAFIGAGSSADAGMPSWATLLGSVKDSLASTLKAPAFDAGTFDHAVAKGDLPFAFGLIEEAVGRDRLELEVRNALPDHWQPGGMTRLIADLPFAGYITTNYDSLLESALGKTDGWVPIGNSPREVPKVSGDARNVVWHLHGGLQLP